MGNNYHSPRYMVVCHLMLVMGLTLIEATQVVGELEQSGLLGFEQKGQLSLKISEGYHATHHS